MVKHKSKEQEYEDTLSDIYDLVQESGSTRAEMQSCLDSIAQLCVDANPELEESSEDETEDEDED